MNQLPSSGAIKMSDVNLFIGRNSNETLKFSNLYKDTANSLIKPIPGLNAPNLPLNSGLLRINNLRGVSKAVTDKIIRYNVGTYSINFTAPENFSMDVLVVGGGGSGGSATSTSRSGGGGGAGGLTYRKLYFNQNITYYIKFIVGSGGAQTGSGARCLGTTQQGHAGGLNAGGGSGAGGGGAGGVGGNAPAGDGVGGGGRGLYFGDIFGSSVGQNGYFASGGVGGMRRYRHIVSAPPGGGGHSGWDILNGGAGALNTGGGGGGALNSRNGGAGGSGVILLKVPINILNSINFIMNGGEIIDSIVVSPEQIPVNANTVFYQNLYPSIDLNIDFPYYTPN